MKRIIALVLSLVMALSLCVPAWATGEVPVADTAELKTALASASSGDIIKLAADTTYDLTTAIPEGVTLEGAGASTVLNLGAAQYKIPNNNITIKNVTIKDEVNNKNKDNSKNIGIYVDGMNLTLESVSYASVNGIAISLRNKTPNVNTLTLKNSNLSAPARGIGECYFSGTILVEESVISSGNSIHIGNGQGTAKIVVKDSTLYGNVAAGTTASFEFEDVTFEVSKLNGSPYNGVSSYSTAAPRTFKNCTFTSATDISMNNVTAAITLVDCNLNGTPITAENITTLMPGNYAAANVTVNGDVVAPVAEVGGVKYKTLQEALTAGGEVTLLDNVTLTEKNTVTKDVVVNLNGKTITSSNTVFYVENGEKGISLTVNGPGKLDTTYLGIWSSGNGNFANTIELNDVTLESEYYGVYHNGSNYGADVTINNSTITNTVATGVGVFLSGSDDWATANKMNKLEITNSSITGDSAVEVKHGNVTVTNSTLTATAAVAMVNEDSGNCAAGGYALAVTNNGMSADDSEAATGTVTINSGNFTGVIGIKAADSTAVVGNSADAKIIINAGYFTADPSDYCADKLTGVASDKAGYLYMVGEKGANPAEVDVAAPVVSADKVDTSNATVKNVVNTIGGTSGVEIDNAALTAAAVGAANENKVTPTAQQAEDLNDLPNISGTTVNDVAIVVQTYFDVEIEEVKVDDTTNKTTSITVDITPMQQTVATTEDVVDSNADIEVGENAVKVGNPVPVKITEPVDITLKLPSTCFAVGDKVYITHKASVGTVIYEATVAADYTITFTTTHGFSPFTISASDPGVKASVGTDNYADLQSAINYAGKDATIVVKASGQTAVVKSEVSFIVTTEAGVSDPTISAGSGYTMTKEDVTGGVKYTFTKVTTGGYYPWYPSTTPDSELVKSAETFDAGVALYVGVSVMGAIGTVALGKKRED